MNITTPLNLNLVKNKQNVVTEISKTDPKLASAVQAYIDSINLKNQVLGIDKAKKVRKHVTNGK